MSRPHLPEKGRGPPAWQSAELVMEAVKLEQHIRNADLVITAEGAIDAQSAFGKTPAGVSRLAHACGVPVIGLCGKLGAELAPLHSVGLTAVFSITPAPITLTEAYGLAEAKVGGRSCVTSRSACTPQCAMSINGHTGHSST